MFRNAIQRFSRFWRKGHHDARKDIRKGWVLFTIVVMWILGLVAVVVVLICVSVIRDNGSTVFGVGAGARSACQPDGTFKLLARTFNFWASSSFFQITLGFGRLNFTEAKTIDIIWDVVVGRGGQSLIALISFRVFAEYLSTEMETSPITFDVYQYFFLQNFQSLIVATYCTIRDFTARLRLRSITAMVFMVATLIFMLGFPTIASAMTGYSTNLKAYIPDTDNNLVEFSRFEYVAFVIEDAGRINETQPLYITIPSNGYDPSPEHEVVMSVFNAKCGNIGSYKCDMLERVIRYALQYSVFETNYTFSVFPGLARLPAPKLNITRYCSDFGTGFEWFHSSCNLWLWNNQTFNENWIQTKGRCQAVDDYQWGFSLIQLTIMVILCILWSTGILTMQTKTRRALRKLGKRDLASDYKAILELANAMHQQLAQRDENEGPSLLAQRDRDRTPSRSDSTLFLMTTLPRAHSERTDLFSYTTMTSSELRRRIKKDLRGGSISRQSIVQGVNIDSLEPTEQTQNRTFWQWLKQHKWWLLLLTTSMCISVATTIIMEAPFLMVFFGITVIVVPVICIGSTSESRAILFFWGFILFGVFPQLAFVGFATRIRAPR
ncbi:hypothetical protein B0J11DRAFT_23162 [Dendryphion nanum]|uniref:Uncharacterized protein n=1 Tax=Dendryphion nanum TaxID=256645 RepID=A0A9P9EI73_9PLEO|nr:hypothetical protein B0J11DRAFT_23162 [Dendryphion nanum]